MQNFFTHPTKRQALLISFGAGLGLMLCLLAFTNFFTEPFDPGPLMGGLMIINLWIIMRSWANYYRQPEEERK